MKIQQSGDMDEGRDSTGLIGVEADAGGRSAKGMAKRRRFSGTIEERFAGRSPDECWLWTGGLARNGYGIATHEGKRWSAHRLAYWLANGRPNLTTDQQVRHGCDVKLCCNPAHLSIGTAQDNSDDAVDRGRTAGGRPLGSNHSNGIADILIMRQRGVSVAKIARELGMSERNVYYHLRELKKLAALESGA